MSTVASKLKELSKMDSYVVLFLVNINSYQRTTMEAIKYLSKEEGLPGVYVSVNKPYQSIKSSLLGEKIDIKTMIFIDAITSVSGGEQLKDEHCLYLAGPENLTDFSISITEAISALNFKNKFLFFDSLNTLLVYNDVDSVARFFHFLASRVRQWQVKGLFVALDKKTDKAIISQIAQFCDKVIDLGG